MICDVCGKEGLSIHLFIFHSNCCTEYTIEKFPFTKPIPSVNLKRKEKLKITIIMDNTKYKYLFKM